MQGRTEFSHFRRVLIFFVTYIMEMTQLKKNDIYGYILHHITVFIVAPPNNCSGTWDNHHDP